ncbi:hypothetical protein PIIN_07097 [Serendipita indica DSM 11827]|uniref:Uncharacterized protein n=1 Tax=Serendipita indica (strain DSM 11827) TaxID=1109443 RepID=G4TPA0_SERID|nr:hypothetical protein PIIN_07097 [Serendipita indica DSM 11827]
MNIARRQRLHSAPHSALAPIDSRGWDLRGAMVVLTSNKRDITPQASSLNSKRTPNNSKFPEDMGDVCMSPTCFGQMTDNGQKSSTLVDTPMPKRPLIWRIFHKGTEKRQKHGVSNSVVPSTKPSRRWIQSTGGTNVDTTIYSNEALMVATSDEGNHHHHHGHDHHGTGDTSGGYTSHSSGGHHSGGYSYSGGDTGGSSSYSGGNSGGSSSGGGGF